MDLSNTQIDDGGQSSPLALAATGVVRRLREANHVAFFAGGCVRDMLLGIAPKDYDIATNAPPNRVRALFANTQPVGAAFGVILVRQDSHLFEVATFRSDGVYQDGRRPESVTFTSAEQDALRRDFTINGMFFDPLEGTVIDYVGGQADLAQRVLRAIGNPDQRFAEDQLRLLRAVRFAARFGLTIEPATGIAIAGHAAALPRISPERIADELRRMLASPTRAVASSLLRKHELLGVLLRQLPDSTGDQGLFDSLAEIEIGCISFGLALALLVLDTRPSLDEHAARNAMATPAIRQAIAVMRKSLKISNDESAQMMGVLEAGDLLTAEPPSVATIKRFLAKSSSADAILLLKTLRHANVAGGIISPLLDRFEALNGEDVAPPPLVNGDDLLRAGAKPGPVFKLVLDAAYDAQLEGWLDTREAAIAYALQRIEPMNS